MPQRLLGSVALVLVAIALFAAGSFAPPWLLRLGELSGVESAGAVRIAAGLLVAFALLVLCSARLAPLAMLLGGTLLFFAGMATLAAMPVVGWPTSLGAAIATTAALGLVVLSRRTPIVKRERGPSDAWRILAALAIITTCLGLAARIPMRSVGPPTAMLVKAPTRFDTAPIVNFELAAWEGKPLRDSGIFEHLPELEAMTRTGTVLLVFYNSRCGHCHDLFRDHFSGALASPVIAVEIPPAPGATLAETDQPEEIDCPQCQRLSLPTGTLWGVVPPAVVRVENGIVTCAREGDSAVCIKP